MALESSPQSVFALTPWRLVCGYPNGRKPTHESTCGACGSAAAFVLPAILSSPLLLVHAAAAPVASAVLPTCCVTYASPADHTSRDASGGRFKGISTIFDCDVGRPGAPPMTRSRVKITKRVMVRRRENYWSAYVSRTSNVSYRRDYGVALHRFILYRNSPKTFSILIIYKPLEKCNSKKLIKSCIL